MAGKGKKSIAMKYSSGEYLKTWQHPAQLRNSDRRSKHHNENISTSSDNYSQYLTTTTRDVGDHGENKEERQAKTFINRLGSIDVDSSTRDGASVGFGVDRTR